MQSKLLDLEVTSLSQNFGIQQEQNSCYSTLDMTETSSARQDPLEEPTASNNVEGTAETLEAMLNRHRAEQRDLNNKIAAMRKSIPKSNKQKKREMTSRISDMEYHLRKRHEEELRALKGESVEEVALDDGISLERLNALTVEEEPMAPLPSPANSATPTKKPNRNKLRKERKEAEMQRLRDEAEKEAENQVDYAAVESAAINELLVPMKLKLQEITADGHCLYNAVANQLKERYNDQTTYKDLREAAAAYMRDHPDDFLPFLYKDDGDMYSSEDFQKYCDDVEKTARWGGQLEILALSRAKQLPIHIVQMGSPVLKINDEEFPGKAPLKLAGVEHIYNKHFKGLQTKVGYTGGDAQHAEYHKVKSGSTQHAEAVQIQFDPTQISYEDLVEFFYKMHDPTTENAQGPDVGSQYRSAIFYHSPEQRTIAEAVTARVQEQHYKDSKIATEIAAASEFYDAETYHQSYLANNPEGYAR
ncbi:Peptide-methionine (S)-S-oxide reductase [Apophysomyces ossiformis]|uniref:peptide-methionine (S)-S-oxide reductase n=1 Tax=Apophysomyces ossiformis TaxID=679940 RepID=A0A8H7BID8_9FUNG|nr:Peptide-methionine (S)-S-oxide reductase [Apophysomyces ossiformis]